MQFHRQRPEPDELGIGLSIIPIGAREIYKIQGVFVREVSVLERCLC